MKAFLLALLSVTSLASSVVTALTLDWIDLNNNIFNIELKDPKGKNITISITPKKMADLTKALATSSAKFTKFKIDADESNITAIANGEQSFVLPTGYKITIKKGATDDEVEVKREDAAASNKFKSAVTSVKDKDCPLDKQALTVKAIKDKDNKPLVFNLPGDDYPFLLYDPQVQFVATKEQSVAAETISVFIFPNTDKKSSTVIVAKNDLKLAPAAAKKGGDGGNKAGAGQADQAPQNNEGGDNEGANRTNREDASYLDRLKELAGDNTVYYIGGGVTVVGLIVGLVWSGVLGGAAVASAKTAGPAAKKPLAKPVIRKALSKRK